MTKRDVIRCLELQREKLCLMKVKLVVKISVIIGRLNRGRLIFSIALFTAADFSVAQFSVAQMEPLKLHAIEKKREDGLEI